MGIQTTQATLEIALKIKSKIEENFPNLMNQILSHPPILAAHSKNGSSICICWLMWAFFWLVPLRRLHPKINKQPNFYFAQKRNKKCFEEYLSKNKNNKQKRISFTFLKEREANWAFKNFFFNWTKLKQYATLLFVCLFLRIHFRLMQTEIQPHTHTPNNRIFQADYERMQEAGWIEWIWKNNALLSKIII